MARTQAADYEDRRQAIVDSAAQLFAERGFHMSSVSDIAAACGASKSALYHYFPSKEDVLFAAMLGHVEQLAALSAEIARSTQPPEGKLRALAHAFMRVYVNARHYHIVLLNERGALPDDMAQRIIGLQRHIIDHVFQILSGVNPRINREAALKTPITMLFMGMVNWTHSWFHPDGKLSADDFADMVTDFTLRGLKALG